LCSLSDAPLDPYALDNLEYSPEDYGILYDELERLFFPYTRVLYGARHPAPCPAWRAEHVLIGKNEYSRFANRVHCFEAGSDGDEDPFGRYVGYLSLRPVLIKKYAYTFTAVANLAPPRFMLRPRYHLITCPWGSTDGVKPFRCVPFRVPNRDTNNYAACLHAAISQALLLKMEAFRFTPISSQDILTLMWREGISRLSPDELRDQGVQLLEALEVLRLEEVSAGAVFEVFRQRDFRGLQVAAQREAVRCITDYLANGIPIILLVNYEGQNAETIPHAVLVFGMHLMSDPEDPPSPEGDDDEAAGDVARVELPGRLVLHDIMTGPFRERSTWSLMHQAWMKDTQEDGDSAVAFLAVAPRGTTVGIGAIRQRAKLEMLCHDGHVLAAYVRRTANAAAGLVPSNPSDTSYIDRWRYVTRLLTTDQIERRYLAQEVDGVKRVDERCRNFFLRSFSSPHKDRWWSVEIRLPRHSRHREAGANDEDSASEEHLPPFSVLFWRISPGMSGSAHSPIPPPDARLQYEKDSVMSLWIERKSLSFAYESHRS